MLTWGGGRMSMDPPPSCQALAHVALSTCHWGSHKWCIARVLNWTWQLKQLCTTRIVFTSCTMLTEGSVITKWLPCASQEVASYTPMLTWVTACRRMQDSGNTVTISDDTCIQSHAMWVAPRWQHLHANNFTSCVSKSCTSEQSCCTAPWT